MIKNKDLILELKIKLFHLYGYDINLKKIKDTDENAKPTSKSFLSPRDFLKYALEDFNQLEERGLINSLANCKRAIDAQLDYLIMRIGFLKICKKENWNFSKKLKFIEDAGIIIPRILSKTNTLRNKLEHEFIIPPIDDVENALDITNLFVSYAELAQIPSLNMSFNGDIDIEYSYDEMYFQFKKYNPINKVMESVGERIYYGCDDFNELYELLTKTITRLSKEYHGYV